MTIPAANVAPNFLLRRSIDASDLRDLQEPAVIFEYQGTDSDGKDFYAYTVAGWLNGENIFNELGGATVGGDVIVIIADSREEADAIATQGLEDTINALDNEADKIIEAEMARDRLNTVGVLDRMDLATRPDKIEAFEEDMAKARTLVGDDLLLAQGH